MLNAIGSALRAVGYGVIVVVAGLQGELALLAGYVLLFIEAAVHIGACWRSPPHEEVRRED